MATIAWIGLGNMGGPMSGISSRPGTRCAASTPCRPRGRGSRARHARRRHHRRRGRRRRRGVHVAAAQRAVREVSAASGVWATAPRSALLLDTSTVDVATSRFCHEESAPVASASSTRRSRAASRAPRRARYVHARRRRGRRAEATGSSSRWPATSSRSAARRWASPRSSRTTSCSSSRCSAVAEGSQLAAARARSPRLLKVAPSHRATRGRCAPGTRCPASCRRARRTAIRRDVPTVLAEKDLSFALAAGEQAGLHLPAAAQTALEQLSSYRRGLRQQGLQPHREVHLAPTGRGRRLRSPGLTEKRKAGAEGEIAGQRFPTRRGGGSAAAWRPPWRSPRPLCSSHGCCSSTSESTTTSRAPVASPCRRPTPPTPPTRDARPRHRAASALAGPVDLATGPS